MRCGKKLSKSFGLQAKLTAKSRLYDLMLKYSTRTTYDSFLFRTVVMADVTQGLEKVGEVGSVSNLIGDKARLYLDSFLTEGWGHANW